MNKILVTGGCGFIGRQVVEQLLTDDYYWDITVVDDLSNPESLSPTMKPFSNEVTFKRLDLSTTEGAREAVKNQEFVIHLAAKIGGIGYFHKRPQLMINDNCKINACVMDAAAEFGVKRFVYLSSSMVYEGSDLYPHKEIHIGKTLPPKTAYGQSKLIGEWMLKAVAEENDMEYSIAIPFNAYGPGEEPKITGGDLEVGSAHVIPDLFYKVNKSDGDVTILGEGNQTRCFTQVQDLARGIVTLVTHPNAKNEAFNLGSSQETSVLELVDMIWDISGKDGKPNIIKTESFKHDVQKRVPSVQKAKDMLGFEVVRNLDEGLEEIWNWYKGLNI
tara:strand:- start:192 stop:1184 length:993 start_codon:yes stop_codon:yes gene_type:complete